MKIPDRRTRGSSAVPRTCLLVLAVGFPATPGPAASQDFQAAFTIEEVLSPAFPYGLVSARDEDRLAWIENEGGVRNVYTAAAPDFAPVPLTANAEDDGVDLRPLQISADGAVVAYIRGHAPGVGSRPPDPDWIASPAGDPDGGTNEVWAASTRGDRPPWRVVTARNFELSPDGRWVLFVENDQIHRAAVDPGVGEQGSESPLFRDFGVNSAPVWSPDGRKIAYVTHRTDHSFIGVYDTERRRISYLAPSVDFDTAPVWSPDGERIAFLRRPGLPYGVAETVTGADPAPGGPAPDGPDGFSEARFRGGYTLGLWVADVESGRGHELWHNPPGDTLFAEVSRIDWVGDHIVFQAEPENWRHYFSVSVSDPTAEPLLLTPGEGEVEHVAFSGGGRWLYYTSNLGDPDRRNLWRVPVAGGPPEQLTDAPGIETFPAVLASGEHVGVLHAGVRRPLTVALVPGGGGNVRILDPALPPGFPADQHVEPENAVITAADGMRFHNQLFLPPDLSPGERRPALIFIHGGPRQQTLLGYHYQAPHGFYHLAYAMCQYFANKGYVVLSVNYRSGIGYGRRFREPPGRGGAVASEYRDILAAGLWLAERPDVDPERVGLWGLSYGGILTTQGLAENSDVFAAGAAIAGVRRSSVVVNIDRWTSPVFLVHGDDDRNVNFFSTGGLVQLLRAHDVPYELIVYPNETHYFLVFQRWIETFQAMDDFFDRALVRQEAVQTTRGPGGG